LRLVEWCAKLYNGVSNAWTWTCNNTKLELVWVIGIKELEQVLFDMVVWFCMNYESKEVVGFEVSKKHE